MGNSSLDNDLLDTLSAPLGDLIASVGKGVAEAQRAMDAATIASFREIYEEGGPEFASSLRAIGYQPTWYRIPKAEAEIAVSLTIAGGGHGEGRLRMYATPVDATFTNRFEYNVQATSRVRITIVPVPAAGPAAELRFMPRVLQSSFLDAARALEARGIAYAVEGQARPDTSALVVRSSHAEGEVVAGGTTVRLQLTSLVQP